MNCKNCNTHISSKESTCPNCGRRTGSRKSRGIFGKTPPAPDPEPLAARSTAVADLGLDLDLDFDQAPEVRSGVSASPMAPKPSELRSILSAQPGLLEPGLSLFQTACSAVSYVTEVGVIDLLLSDSKGGLRVVSIPESPDINEALNTILPQIGWVVRNESGPNQNVSGIVLLPRLPASIDYAAAAVADRVSFRTYRMTLRFDLLEL
jgi:hypothetical protein